MRSEFSLNTRPNSVKILCDADIDLITDCNLHCITPILLYIGVFFAYYITIL